MNRIHSTNFPDREPIAVQKEMDTHRLEIIQCLRTDALLFEGCMAVLDHIFHDAKIHLAL